MTRPKSARGKPGRKPETLRVEGDWKDAVKRALKRGKPPRKKAKRKRK